MFIIKAPLHLVTFFVICIKLFVLVVFLCVCISPASPSESIQEILVTSLFLPFPVSSQPVMSSPSHQRAVTQW